MKISLFFNKNRLELECKYGGVFIMIKGIGASSGIAIAKAYKLVMPDLTVTQNTVEDAELKSKNMKML